jgi:hypothetical protein
MANYTELDASVGEMSAYKEPLEPALMPTTLQCPGPSAAASVQPCWSDLTPNIWELVALALGHMGDVWALTATSR